MKFLKIILPALLIVSSCLFANGDMSLTTRWSTGLPVRLDQRTVTLNAQNGLAFMEVEDIFQNLSGAVCEGIYRFRLPEGGFAAGFSINTDEKEWKKGEIREITQAREIYKTITSRLVDPGILEQKDGELTIKVFPVERNKKVGVRFRCYFPASIANEKMVFILPTGFDGPGNPLAMQNEETSMKVKFKLAASIHESGGLSEVLCSESSLKMKMDGGSADINGSIEAERMENIVISFKQPEIKGISHSAYQVPSGKKFSLFRVDGSNFADSERPVNVSVIIDGSGSMGGKNRERVLNFCRLLEKNDNVSIKKFVLKETGISAADDLESVRFYGPTDWAGLSEFTPSGKDAVIILSDAAGLRQVFLRGLYKKTEGVPVWLVAIGSDYRDSLAAMVSGFGGYTHVSRKDDQAQTEAKVRALVEQIRVAPAFLDENGAACMPLFGSLDRLAYFVLPFKAGNFQVKNKEGKILLDHQVKDEPSGVETAPWFVSMAVRQHIKTLESVEQTEEIIKKITDLGLKYGQATDYTAFLAVPEQIAQANKDVMNPAYLAMFAAPNFRKAREQARQKACFANQRVLLGAIEMYLMDNTDASGLKHDPETGRLDREALIKGKYLKSDIIPAERDCDYRIIGDLMGNSLIFCVVHGSPEGEDSMMPVEELVKKFCADNNLDPDDFDVPYQAYRGGGNIIDLWALMYRYESLMMLLSLLM
ncbi:MAG: VIT domain-containing protein [Candidatus Rifleibacteriota bacterium]